MERNYFSAWDLNEKVGKFDLLIQSNKLYFSVRSSWLQMKLIAIPKTFFLLDFLIAFLCARNLENVY